MITQCPYNSSQILDKRKTQKNRCNKICLVCTDCWDLLQKFAGKGLPIKDARS